jgi:hypothetical protein
VRWGCGCSDKRTLWSRQKAAAGGRSDMADTVELLHL